LSEIYSELNTENLKKKAVKGAGINVAAQFLNLLFHFAGVVILARLLTPKDFGLVAMVTAFSLLPMNFGVNGFSEFLFQKQSLYKNELNALFWLHVFIAICLSFLFTFFGLFLAKFYEEEAIFGIAAAMASSFIFTALSTTPRALIKREMKYAGIALGDLLAGILSIVCAVFAALAGMAYWAVVIRQLVGPALNVIIAWSLCPWRPESPKDFSSALPGLKFALKIYVNFIIDYLTKSVDKVLLGRFHGSSLLGNYDRAYQLSSLPAGQILIPLRSVALSTLSRLQGDKTRFIQYYLKSTALVTFLGSIASVVLMLSAADLIPLLLGPGWDETSLILMAFSPGIAAMLIYGTIAWLHLSLGTPGKWLRWNIAATIITVVSFACAAPFGAVAMAAAYSSAKFVLVLPGIWYASRPIDLKISALLRSIWPYFAAGLATSIVWLSLPYLWPFFGDFFQNLSLLARVIMTAFITPSLYMACLVVLQRNFSSFREIFTLLRIFLKR
jgi:PST family polysaccharide transporter